MLNRIKQIIAITKQHLGMSISIFLHFFLFSLLLLSFPQCKRKTNPEIIISVDLLPIKTKSNVANKEAENPEPKKEIKPVEKPKPIEEIKSEEKKEIKPIEEISKKEDKPILEKPKPAEPIKQKQETHSTLKPKKEEKKAKANDKKPTPKKKNTKPKVNEYDALLKNLEETVKKNQEKEKSQNTSKGANDLTNPLSLSVKDSIKRQIEQCWNPPAGNKDAGKLQVLLNISFNSDGAVASVKIVDNIRYNSDGLYKVAADAAMRAVYKCSPLKDLPAEQYSSWQNLEMNFDPSSLIY